MCLDGRGDLVRPVVGETVGPTGDGDEARVRNARGEGASDGERAHRIRVAPEEQGSRLDRVQAAAEIGPIMHEPTRHSRDGEEILWPPVDRRELCQVEATGCSDEHQPAEAFGVIQREPGSEHPAHRLSNDVAGLFRKALEQPTIEGGERLDGRVARNVAESRPAKDVNWAEVSESISDGAPERGAASRARKEYKPRHPARLV